MYLHQKNGYQLEQIADLKGRISEIEQIKESEMNMLKIERQRCQNEYRYKVNELSQQLSRCRCDRQQLQQLMSEWKYKFEQERRNNERLQLIANEQSANIDKTNSVLKKEIKILRDKTSEEMCELIRQNQSLVSELKQLRQQLQKQKANFYRLVGDKRVVQNRVVELQSNIEQNNK